jgi:hypothetical protein
MRVFFFSLLFCCLSCIFQVIGPIRVYSIGSPQVPGFWSFGPCPRRPSSEGFLATFTPGRIWEDSYLPLDFFSEYARKVHFSIKETEPRAHSEPSSQRNPSQGRETAFQRPPSGRDQSVSIEIEPTSVPRGSSRIDLMILRPNQGILVSLKPTDEALWERPKYLKLGSEGSSRKYSFGAYNRRSA